MTAPILNLYVDPSAVDAAGNLVTTDLVELVISGVETTDVDGPVDIDVVSPLFATIGVPTSIHLHFDTWEAIGKGGEFGFFGLNLLSLMRGTFAFTVTATDPGGTTVVSTQIKVGFHTTVGADTIYLPQGARGTFDQGLLTSNDLLPPILAGYEPTLNIRGVSGSPDIGIVNGAYSLASSFTGVAHLTQTVGVSDFVVTDTGLMTVHVQPLGTNGSYGYVKGGAGSEFFFYDAADKPVQIAAGAGDDRVYASQGGGSFNGEAGNDFIQGGAGKDVITGGAGADYLIGDGGADVFVIRKGDIAPGDVIADFTGAGNGWKASDDLIRFEGFSPNAKLVHVAGTSTYTLVDGSYQADLTIQADGALGKGDYGFYG